MSGSSILERARRRAGLSQEQLAQRSRTSRTAVSAYEHGRKSPSVDTLERLLAAAGFELGAHPHVEFAQVAGSRGRSVWVPSHLPQLPPDRALATVRLPVTVNWSQPDRVFHLADRHDRARLYEIVLSEGEPEDILRYVDGALLVDLWSELVLSRKVRQAWAPLVDAVLAAEGARVMVEDQAEDPNRADLAAYIRGWPPCANCSIGSTVWVCALITHQRQYGANSD